MTTTSPANGPERAAYDVFISYSTKDAAVADAARAVIEASGMRCWIAPRDISPGVDWSEAIIDAIEECRVFVLIFSGASNDSEQVKREVQNAVGRRLPILPFRVEDVPLSKPMRYFIGTPHWLDALAPPLERNLDRLVEAVRRLLERDTATETPLAPLQNLEALPHNLPHQLTSFIGRDKERAEVRQLLTEARLITLMGAGGCGKTRLAFQVAREVLEDFPDGVWLVELESLAAPSLVTQTVASVLNVREEAGRPLLETLTASLRDKRLLLVLDNCEHVVAECARLSQTLLQSTPELRVLATSREALGIVGEVPWRVPSLALPDLNHLPSPATLGTFEVVQLFVDRARAQSRAFSLTADNAAAVAQICCRLDGIPLAIELAAARVKVLPPEKIALRLDDRFRLLKGGSRTALPRQQTLEAAIAWSYDLLEGEERTVLHRLAVFAGWEVEAAEAVCVSEEIEDYEVLDYLSQLVDKSLVATEETAGFVRYRLLESVRAYSRARLDESGETETVRGRHARWYQAMAQEANADAANAGASSFDQLEIEQDNLRAALDWLLANGEAAEPASLCIALADFWESRGRFSESRTALERCLERLEEIDDMHCRADLLATAGWFPYLQGDHDAASRHQQHSLKLSRAAGHKQGEATALNHLALIAYARGRATEAREAFEASLVLVRELDDQTKLAARLSNVGLLEIQEGRHDRARELLEEALAIYRREHDAQGVAGCLCNLAELALRRRDWDAAEPLARQSLEQFRLLQERRGIAYALANAAEAAAHRDDMELTIVKAWLREATEICRDTGMHWLVPSLLETLACCLSSANEKNDAAPDESHFVGALFSLSAAEHLRRELEAPRTVDQERDAAAVETKLREVLDYDTIESARVVVGALNLDEIIMCVLGEDGGEDGLLAEAG